MSEIRNLEPTANATLRTTIDPQTGEPTVIRQGAMEYTPGNPVEDAENAALAKLPPDKLAAEMELREAHDAAQAQDADLSAQAAEQADPRFEPFTRELQQTGNLSADSVRKAAEVFGVPEHVVRQYVDAQSQALAQAPHVQALHDSQVKAAHAAVGGESNWGEFVGWLNEHGTPEDRALVTQVIQGRSPSVTRATIGVVYQRFQAAAKASAQEAAQLNAANGGPFASKDEMFQAMRDSRYRTDPQYRRSVEQRIAKSNF